MKLGACLHGGGGPQVGEAACSGSPQPSCKRDQIKMRDYMERRVTSPRPLVPSSEERKHKSTTLKTQDNDFLFLFLDFDTAFRIQLQKNSLTFEALNEME